MDGRTLPDGIRQSQASHILLKLSQSLDKDALVDALGYDQFYKDFHNLEATDVQIIVCAKQSRLETRKPFGYEKMHYPGFMKAKVLWKNESCSFR